MSVAVSFSGATRLLLKMMRAGLGQPARTPQRGAVDGAGREHPCVDAVDRNHAHGPPRTMSSDHGSQVLAEHDIPAADAGVDPGERLDPCERGPREVRAGRATRRVILGCRTADQHPARPAPEAARQVGRKRGNAVTLDQHRVTVVRHEPPEDGPRECEAAGRLHLHGDAGRLADGAAARHGTDEDRQIHTRRQSLEHPRVGATLHHERDALARHFTATISECRPNGDSRRDRSRTRIGARPGHGR